MCLTTAMESQFLRLENFLLAIGVTITSLEAATPDLNRNDATCSVIFLATEAQTTLKAIQTNLKASCQGSGKA
jgi:hypothetical protein